MVKRVYVLVGIVVILLVLGAFGQIATVRPIKEAQTVAAISNGGTAFSATGYVDSIWKSRVIPTAEKDAVPLQTLVTDLQNNVQTATQRYGHDVGGAYSFLVRFSGKVTKVDTSSPTGSITVLVPVGGKTVSVKVQIGPVILGTSLRDALKFITFEEFLNQVQYGSVADSLNSRVENDVVSKLNLKTLVGKTIHARGAFTYDGSNATDLLVTPIAISVGA